MRIKQFDRILSVAAVVLWMVLIFWFSANNGQSSNSMSGGFIEKIAGFFNSDFNTLSAAEQADIVNSWQTVVRKGAHFAEYAMLGLLVSNMLRSFGIKNLTRLLSAPLICLVYAVTDEVHQYFVPDRACRMTDVLIDTAGGLFGAAVFFAAVWLFCRRKLKKGRENDTKTQTLMTNCRGRNKKRRVKSEE